MVLARVLKFHTHVPCEKIVDPYFCSCPSFAPFSELNVPLKIKFDNLLYKITRRVKFKIA